MRFSPRMRSTRYIFAFAALLTCGASASLFGQAVYTNMEDLGTLNPRSSPSGSLGSYSACWGYTAPDGREYALLAAYSGTSFIDITDAPSLVEVDFLPGPLNSWREMKTYTHYAYIVSEASSIAGGAGIQIVDLRYLPDSVHHVKTFLWTDVDGGTTFPRVHSISQNGPYLYLNGGNYNGVRILSLQDPENPVRAGVYNGPYVHDSHIRNDTIYAAAINSGGGLDIVDARDKANPVRVTLLQYPGSGTHNVWTSPEGKYALTTDEIGTTGKTLKVWDMSTMNPLPVTSLVGPGGSIVHNVFIKGNLAYVAWYTAGLRVVEIAELPKITVLGSVDTRPGDDEATYSGAWGADPFFPSGKVIISDMQTGLYVTRFTGDRRGTLTGTVRDANSAAPLAGVLIHFKGQPSLTRWTDATGEYLFGFAPGPQKAWVEKDGYISEEVTFNVPDSGATEVFDFTLSPIATKIPREVELPGSFHLGQNYPNPFNPDTRIPYSLPASAHIRLTVQNVLGQEIAVLYDGVQSAGQHAARFDASARPTGVYFVTLTSQTFRATRRMILAK